MLVARFWLARPSSTRLRMRRAQLRFGRRAATTNHVFDPVDEIPLAPIVNSYQTSWFCDACMSSSLTMRLHGNTQALSIERTSGQNMFTWSEQERNAAKRDQGETETAAQPPCRGANGVVEEVDHDQRQRHERQHACNTQHTHPSCVHPTEFSIGDAGTMWRLSSTRTPQQTRDWSTNREASDGEHGESEHIIKADNATTDIRTEQREVRQPAAQQRKQRHQRSAKLLHQLREARHKHVDTTGEQRA